MRKVGVAFIMILCAMPFVLAIDTTIEVTTEPSKFVMIRIFEGNNRINLLESIFDRRVDFNNQVIVKHSSAFSQLDIEVYIKDKPNGDTRYYKRYEKIPAGGTFKLTLPETAGQKEETDPPRNETNQTQPGNVTNSTNLSVQEIAPTITGNAIQEASLFSRIKWYYVVAGVLLAVILVAGSLIVKDRRTRKGPMSAPKTPPGSTKDPKELEVKLRETERRLEQATREISRIKNEDQIKEIQRNIEAQQEQIRKLKQGYS